MWLYTDLLQALKGERLSSVFSPDGTLISVSAAPHCGVEGGNTSVSGSITIRSKGQRFLSAEESMKPGTTTLVGHGSALVVYIILLATQQRLSNSEWYI